MHEVGSVIGALALVLAGLLGVAAIVRRLAPQLGRRFQRIGRLQHLDLLSLTPQCSIALVQMGRELLVLGLTPHAVTLLTKTQDLSVAEEEQTRAVARGQKDETGKPQHLSGEELEVAL